MRTKLNPKPFLKFGLIGAFLSLLLSTVQAQQQGELVVLVQNKENSAISSATVRIHNANLKLERLGSTDADGRVLFQNLPTDSNYCITVSYVGMLPKDECAVIISNGKRSSAIIVLKDPALNEMDQVVVTAIGIKQQKRKLGYATQEVNTEVLQEAKTMNIGTALTGQVAGLIVNNPTGIFQAPTFNLRGRSPMIVVDGIPVESELFDIPAQHIENINVLKGTAASVLYGFRGRDGAIMITTKNAKVEGLEVTIGTTNMMSAGFTVFPESQTEFGSGSNGQYEFWDGADGGISDGDMTWGPKLNTGLLLPQWNSPIRDKQTGTVIPWYGDVSGTIYDDKSRYERVPIEWRSYDNLRDFLGTGIVTENNFTLSHKSEKLSLFTSGKYAYQKGQVPNTSLNSGGININSNYRFTPKLNLDINFSYNKVKSPNFPRYGYGPKNHMYTILLWMGNDVNGQDLANNLYIPGQEGYRQANYNYAWYNNPYFAANELNQVFDQDVVHAQSRLNWQVTPKFNVQGRIAARQKTTFEDMQSPKSYMNYGDSRNGDYKMWNNGQLNFDADVLATYSDQFGDNFGLNINAGASTFKRTLSNTYQSTDGLVVPFIYNLGNTQGPVRATNANHTSITRSAYASVNFDIFRSTYLNFSGRNDWSSTLSAENNSYFYPSASFSTIVSDYIPMPRAIDYVKLYSSWASVSSALDPYSIRAVYNKALTYGSTPSVSYPSGIINPNILPEQSNTWEMGMAFAFLKNRLNMDVTYYDMRDRNQIIQLENSDASGFATRMVNGNVYRTQGVEVMLGARIIENDNFSWRTAVNWTRSVRRLQSIYGDQARFGNLYQGDRADAYYDQVWQKNADGQLILNPTTGMPIRDPFPRYLGYFNPDWQFGFSNTFMVKNIRVQMDIDGSIGGVMRSQTIEKMWWGGKHPSSTQYRQEEYDAGQNVYRPSGVIVTGGEVKYDVQGNITEDTRTYAPFTDAVSWQTWSQIYPYQARVTESESSTFANVYDRSFVKLRRLSVGYDLNKWLKSSKFKALDASVFGTNLWVWKNIPYIDPDFGIGNDDNLQDPSTRYLGVSLNLTF
ncbi:SusC/RagA family TonB-linked outer membrane protein [Sphingobacterium corticibacter]|uniref:SusC/RagA family TonB-linked outer membrane protein n=1 Tax=Sphingobacterium corticibacter TaxID=2171749 RepID=A0A2T8HJ84_9SPHI|nr:SusC/RagA family TonB-linked outer membrane protein [Sphingobacterium corticibacter]PVH25463.1 SusC/RagA family TonB-linked outer membrane protein [Sphingobacterium corticibacter]